MWDADGHIVTNYHVIRGAADVLVSCSAAGSRKSDALLVSSTYLNNNVFGSVLPPAHLTSLPLLLLLLRLL